MHKLLISLVVLLLLAGCDWPGGSPSTRDRVESLAEREIGNGGEVEIELSDRVDGCEFYRTSTPDVLDSFPTENAVLKDGRLVSSRTADNDDAAQILRTCGANADAVWLAHKVEQFGEESTGLVVEGEDEGFARRQIRDAGKSFRSPSLQTGDDGAQKITYFTMNYELSEVNEVTVTLPTAGPIVVAARSL